jgi:hypothetical protein
MLTEFQMENWCERDCMVNWDVVGSFKMSLKEQDVWVRTGFIWSGYGTQLALVNTRKWKFFTTREQMFIVSRRSLLHRVNYVYNWHWTYTVFAIFLYYMNKSGCMHSHYAYTARTLNNILPEAFYVALVLLMLLKWFIHFFHLFILYTIMFPSFIFWVLSAVWWPIFVQV